jgi:hypothetical protein
MPLGSDSRRQPVEHDSRRQPVEHDSRRQPVERGSLAERVTGDPPPLRESAIARYSATIDNIGIW